MSDERWKEFLFWAFMGTFLGSLTGVGLYQINTNRVLQAIEDGDHFYVESTRYRCSPEKERK